jgi:uncharacterized protein
MAKDQIRYDLLTQDALRQVIRRVLSDAAREGLPGDHHFYVSFRTGDPGVRMSQRLRGSYPEEMTIVLQHQFWDLQVSEQTFEVGLAFGGMPERLLVPFSAITGFFDPSVEFGVKFESGSEEGATVTPVQGGKPGEGAAVMNLADVAGREHAPAATEKDAGEDKPAEDGEAPASPPGGGEVVRLDQFRKKP